MKGRNKLLFLGVIVLFLLVTVGAIHALGTQTPRKEYDLMTDAAHRFERAVNAVRAERLARGLPIAEEDTLQLGLLGAELSPITTTLGDAAAKRTAQTSDMAALCVRLLTEAGVKAGDRVGACMSGSFPGLNIALLCACDAMGAEVVYTAGVGASTYGANLCGFTSPEMLMHLYQNGFISTPPASISAGGEEDSGTNMLGRILEEEAAIEQTLTRVKRLGVPFVCYPDLAQNVAYHAERYGDIDCFVNVGGTVVGSGANYVVLGLGQGLLSAENVVYQEKSGLLEYYLAKGVPAIHLLNVKRLCLDYGIPFDPESVPEVGQTAVYYGTSYPKLLILAVGLSVVAALLLYRERVGRGTKQNEEKRGITA